jgi:hypothetical protein
MKSLYPIALAVVMAILMSLTPAYAYASKNAGSARTHSETYHDRTPTVHTHSSHSHHHG